MTDKEKAIVLGEVTTELEGLVRTNLTDAEDIWLDMYTRIKLNSYKEILYKLTKDEMWLLDLEELVKLME